MLTITFCLEDGPKRYSEWPLGGPASSAVQVYASCVILRFGSGLFVPGYVLAGVASA